MTVDFIIPDNSFQTIKIIRDICSNFPDIDMRTFKILNGIDWNQSICSKPSDLLLIPGGLLGAIFNKQLETKPIGIVVNTIHSNQIKIYFDRIEGYYVDTENITIRYKTFHEFNLALRTALYYFY